MITFNTENVSKRINDKIIKKRYSKKVKKIVDEIQTKRSVGEEMLGWINYVNNFRTKELLEMKKKVQEWKKEKVACVLIIGIGGSFIGSRAAIKMCGKKEDGIKTIFVSNIYPTNLLRIKEKIKNKKFSIVVISKSGTTLEPAIAFNYFRKDLIKRVGEEKANELIVAITDEKNGILRKMANKNKWTTYEIPDDVGGRFSALTPVGIFVIAISGLNTLEVFNGAKQAMKDTETSDLTKNSAYLYACYRHHFHVHNKKSVENFVVYDPNLIAFCDLYRQLFAESEGKEGKGLFPSVCLFTTDLHSMGQFLQEGSKIFFETTLLAKKMKSDIKLTFKNDDDGLEFLNNKTIGQINEKAAEATINAHSKEGKIDNLVLKIDKNDEYNFGYLYIWMCRAVTMSGYLLSINPFDQPGVEKYKQNMFKLLGKNA